MAEEDLVAEAEQSRAILTQELDLEISGFCYPYGHLDEAAVAAVQRAGYSYGCAIWRSTSTGPHALPRVYVGETDKAHRLWAKGARHWLTWDYRGPGAARLGRLSGTGPSTSQDAPAPAGIQQLT